MQVKVSVTKKHIKNGKEYDCRACPVVLALLDAGFEKVCIFGGYDVKASKLKGRTMHNIDLPEEVSKVVSAFVQEFDHGNAVAPFKFKFELPDKLAKQVGFGRPVAA